VTETGVEILTARTKDSPPLWWEHEDRKKEGAAADTKSEAKVETRKEQKV
jgi:hypothetical protein